MNSIDRSVCVFIITIIVTHLFVSAHAETKGPADQLLRTFHHAVEDALLPQVEEIKDYDAVVQKIYQLASVHLLPQKELLHQHAIWQIKQLPRLQLPRVETWQSLVSDEVNQLLRQPELLKNLTAAFGKTGGSNESVLLLVLWNPIRATHWLHSMLLARFDTPSVMGMRTMIRQFAPLELALVGGESDTPEIALIGSQEVFTVQYHYVKEGYFMPQKIALYRKPNTQK